MASVMQAQMDSRPRGIIDSLGIGFSLVARRPILLVIPLLLDLFLWLGPRLSISTIASELALQLPTSVGETTEDREYSLDVVRCLGACGLAPVVVIDEDTHGQVEPSKVVEIVESYRGQEEV